MGFSSLGRRALGPYRPPDRRRGAKLPRIALRNALQNLPDCPRLSRWRPAILRALRRPRFGLANPALVSDYCCMRES